MKQGKKGLNTATRDPDRTRRRILAAALAEFSAHGFAGARVDTIARRARGNKRMLYHYFGNKEALFTAVLRCKMTERQNWAQAMSDDPAERLPFWFKAACEDPNWIRLLEWEALQANGTRLIDEKERRDSSLDWLNRLEERQKKGKLTKQFKRTHLALAMQSLTIFPSAFPQLARLITGKPVNDPKFRAEYGQFLKEFAAAFKPTSRTSK